MESTWGQHLMNMWSTFRSILHNVGVKNAKNNVFTSSKQITNNRGKISPKFYEPCTERVQYRVFGRQILPLSRIIPFIIKNDFPDQTISVESYRFQTAGGGVSGGKPPPKVINVLVILRQK